MQKQSCARFLTGKDWGVKDQIYVWNKGTQTTQQRIVAWRNTITLLTSHPRVSTFGIMVSFELLSYEEQRDSERATQTVKSTKKEVFTQVLNSQRLPLGGFLICGRDEHEPILSFFSCTIISLCDTAYRQGSKWRYVEYALAQYRCLFAYAT